ncbi:hypothetical protein [Novosphingobium colocasiae]|uniref:hypothetical protein n=1 Tax=Novosphingobium colocasiae TaxID=1256513 RepID=UPI0035AE0CFF
MTQPAFAVPVPVPLAAAAPSATTITLTPQDRPQNRGRRAVLSAILSLAVIAVVLHEMGGIALGGVLAMVPTTPLFWAAFAASYLALPVSEWLIFRRLWGIPAAGFVALLRKRVYNELLLGYLGEAYFYTWARRHVTLEATPFGAVKDVAILSAMTGNAVTVALLAIVAPIVGTTTLGIDSRPLLWSLAVILCISVAAMIFRRQVFSLPRRDLMMITRLHLARIALSTFLLALLWRLVLPDVPLSWWLFLATLRLLVSRLPLLPNKDLLFAGIAVMALGHEKDIGELMALIAGLLLATHLTLGSVLALVDLARPERSR